MGFIKESDALRSRVPSCSVEMAIDLARFGNGRPPLREISVTELRSQKGGCLESL